MIEVAVVAVLDYQPAEQANGHEYCQRCGWAPDEYRQSSLKNNLWSTPCVFDADVEDLTSDRIVWQILCGPANPEWRWADGSTGIGGRGCISAMPEISLASSLWVPSDDDVDSGYAELADEFRAAVGLVG